jgi:hypothetical protein
MPLFTPEVSRQYATKALAARRANRQTRLNREALLKRLLAAEDERLTQAAENPPIKPADSPDDFVSRKLERVRLQWGKLDALLAEQLDKSILDAGAIDRIVAALCRVAELERTLSGRPMPGSFRPEKPRRQVQGFTPPTDG